MFCATLDKEDRHENSDMSSRRGCQLKKHRPFQGGDGPHLLASSGPACRHRGSSSGLACWATSARPCGVSVLQSAPALIWGSRSTLPEVSNPPSQTANSEVSWTVCPGEDYLHEWGSHGSNIKSTRQQYFLALATEQWLSHTSHPHTSSGKELTHRNKRLWMQALLLLKSASM